MALTPEQEMLAVERMVAAVAAATAKARAEGVEILARGTRVAAAYPFADHASLGTIELGPFDLGAGYGYLVMLNTPLPPRFKPCQLPFTPQANITVLGPPLEGP